MPQFTLHRNYVLRTTKGHQIRFIKGKPTNVPPVCVPDAIAIGAQAVEGEKVKDVLGEEKKAAPSLTPEQRKAKVFEAFGIMKTRGERNDFTASGIPNAKRLPALTGFELTPQERDSYWQEYREAEQEAAEQAKLDRKTEKELEKAAKAKDDD